MALSKEFVLAWRTWQLMTPSFDVARANRTQGSTFAAEHDLDHLTGYVRFLGHALIDGKENDYARLAGQELRALDGIRALLDQCAGDDERAGRLRAFVDATESVLKAVVNQDTKP